MKAFVRRQPALVKKIFEIRRQFFLKFASVLSDRCETLRRCLHGVTNPKTNQLLVIV